MNNQQCYQISSDDEDFILQDKTFLSPNIILDEIWAYSAKEALRLSRQHNPDAYSAITIVNIRRFSPYASQHKVELGWEGE